MTNRTIALVIGWGSVKCVAALGLISVLKREGIKIDLVVGSGAGSIFGALYALGHEADEIVAMTKRLWTKEIAMQRKPGGIFQLLLPSAFKNENYFSLRDDRLINERLHEAFRGRQFEDAVTRLLVSATDYITGEQVVLSEGSLFDAVRASIALPMIFAPVDKDEMVLVDGFLSSPFPVDVAIKEKADIILAMGFDSVFQNPITTLPEYLVHLSGILSNNLFQASYAYYNLVHHYEVIPIVPELASDIHFFDTDRFPEIIQAGEKEGEKHIDFLKKLLRGEE